MKIALILLQTYHYCLDLMYLCFFMNDITNWILTILKQIIYFYWDNLSITLHFFRDKFIRSLLLQSSNTSQIMVYSFLRFCHYHVSVLQYQCVYAVLFQFPEKKVYKSLQCHYYQLDNSIHAFSVYLR